MNYPHPAWYILRKKFPVFSRDREKEELESLCYLAWDKALRTHQTTKGKFYSWWIQNMRGVVRDEIRKNQNRRYIGGTNFNIVNQVEDKTVFYHIGDSLDMFDGEDRRIMLMYAVGLNGVDIGREYHRTESWANKKVSGIIRKTKAKLCPN